MKRILFTGLLAMLALASTRAETYHVLSDGNDANSGKINTSDGAWQSINHAFNKLEAGDTLLIGDGLYRILPVYYRNVHATREDPTVIASQNRHLARITLEGNPEEGNVLNIEHCSYLEIDGLEVFTEAPNRGTGIEASKRSHHITIRNCYVHDCGCGGISGRGSDYITIENNVVQGNATRSYWNCSGISLLLPVNIDDEPGYHLIIRNNVSLENECRHPFVHGGFDRPTDGNGIILDLFNNHINSTEEGQIGGYRSATLIENNVSLKNGGRGINIFNSDRVTIRNNTCYHNLHVLSEYSDDHGEIESYHSQDLEWYGNVIIKNPTLKTHAVHLNIFGNGNNSLGENFISGEIHLWPVEVKEEK